MSKGAETRQRIIELAAPLYNRRGFEGFSMHEVMLVTGLEKGGIYRHFRSKEELAAAALKHLLSLSIEPCIEVLDLPSGALEKLTISIRRFVELVPRIEGGCPLLNTAVDTDDGNPILRKIVRCAMGRWRERLQAVLNDGIAGGEIQRDTEVPMMADMIISSLEGALVVCRIERDPTPLAHAEQMLNNILQAMSTRAPSIKRL